MKQILQKLHAIMSELGFIEKDKTNAFHGYRYASEQAIKEAIHPLLVKYKVLFTFSVTGVSSAEFDSEKKKQRITTVNVLYKFTDVDSGEEIQGTFSGEGIDSGDKAIYKAITGAIKYVLTSNFLIPTGDDPENEKKSRTSQRSASNSIPETQILDPWKKKDPKPQQCQTCGAVATRTYGVSKKGKEFNMVECSKDKTHVQWLPVNPDEMLSF